MLALREAAGAALLLQLARLLIVDSARRASLPPVTAVGLLCYSFAAAAAALGALPPASAATLEPSALAASPARLLASLLLEDLVPEGGILDVGAFDGVFANFYAELMPHRTIYAIDPSMENIKKNRSLLLLCWIVWGLVAITMPQVITSWTCGAGSSN